MASKIKLSILLLFLVINAWAQDPSKPFIHKHLTRATLTFGTGYMPQPDLTNVYIFSDLEYYTGAKISLRGENFIFLNSLNNQNTLLSHHGIFVGPMYHFKTNTHLDPFAGIMTGISITETQQSSTIDPTYQIKSGYGYNPLFTSVAGINYYATRYFHLFINGRWVGGTHVSQHNKPMNLSEFRFCFGLGFNIL